MAQMSVKIINGGLDETPLRGGTIILRGVIDPGSLRTLKYDEYQREAPSMARQKDLVAALRSGEPLPDIEVGMRGSRTRDMDGSWFLLDDCYVIDGKTRVMSSIQALTENPTLPVRQGACIHFNTERRWERERFHKLNGSARLKLSPNVLLRNMREDHVGISAIHALSQTNAGHFALGQRICWDQNMTKGQLVTALNVCKAAARLHAHIGASAANNIDELAGQLDMMVERLTPSQFRNNLRHFYEVVDDVWGIRQVHYKDLAKYLTSGFLETLAKIFTNHSEFWRGVNDHQLMVEVQWRRKLGTFPINDPNIFPIASGAGSAKIMLYQLMLEHLNSGRRTRRLKSRRLQANEAESEAA